MPHSRLLASPASARGSDAGTLHQHASQIRKITVEVPADVLDRAIASGEGVTDVVRENHQAWLRVAEWAGKVKWSVSLEELRA